MSTDISGLVERARATVASAKADPTKAPANERLELQRVAQQFEAMLLTQMLREMRKAGELEKDGSEGDGMGLGLGSDTFTETIDSELALYLARNKGLGLTSQLMQAFDRLAGTSATPAAPEAVVTPLASPPPVAPEATNGMPLKVTSEFGWRSDPFTGQTRFHKGIDLRAAYGQDVQAAAPGTVVFSGEQRGYGTTVVIEHADGTRSRYAHLSAATVETGSPVTAGQGVGRAGKSGRATGTHLHFEVTSPEGKPISPSQWMQRWATTTEA